MEYLVPDDVAAAVRMLGAGRVVLAGGTDLYPQHVGRPMTTPMIDIGGLADLRGIDATADTYRIGALTRWADVARAALPSRFDGLRAAARQVGAVQVQNAATVGRQPVQRVAGRRRDPAAADPRRIGRADVASRAAACCRSSAFLTGYRQTALQPDELLTAVLIPRGTRDDARSAFLKLGLRRYLVISVVMVAVEVTMDPDDRIAEARVAVGACSPVAQRLRSLEAALVGRSLDDVDVALIAEHLAALSPIDDVRATADYRRRAAAVLVRRALQSCGGDR